MDDERELIDALRADADNPARKRAYAEWLAAHGKPDFAELLRLQEAPAPADVKERSKIGRKLERLEGSVREQFEHPLYELGVSGPGGWDLITNITVSIDTFLEKGAEILAAAPIHTVSFASPGNAAALADCPHLRQLQTIAYGAEKLTPDVFRLFINSPHLEGLRTFGMFWREDFTADCVRELSKAALPGLRELTLGRTALKAEGAAHLANWPGLAHVEELNLWSCEIRPDGMRAFAASPYLGALRTLKIGGNGLGDEGLMALTQAASLTALEELDLGGDYFGPEGMSRFAAWPGLARVRVLGLNHCYFGDGGLIALASSPHLRNLEVLELQGNKLGDEGVAALVRAPIVARLTKLYMPDNHFGSGAAQALVDSEILPDTLEELNLSCCKVSRTNKAGKALKARFGGVLRW